MATHFARGILTEGQLVSIRLSSPCHIEARNLPAHRTDALSRLQRSSRRNSCLCCTEFANCRKLLFRRRVNPRVRDKNLPGFSISYAGNMVGVALTTEGECGLDMALQRTTRGFHRPSSLDRYPFSRNEVLWVANQNDPNEARAQLITLRQSVLKLTGDVMNNDPQELQLFPVAGRLKCAHVTQLEAVCDAEDVLVWSVAVTPAMEKLKVWEFDVKAGWKSLPDIQTRANEPTGRLMRFAQLSAVKSYTLNRS
ncbi:phosphopantetheinyl transferase [Salmonella bongori]|nr:phosphopantetheinyl transferase [Salmonella bongori]